MSTDKREECIARLKEAIKDVESGEIDALHLVTFRDDVIYNGCQTLTKGFKFGLAVELVDKAIDEAIMTIAEEI